MLFSCRNQRRYAFLEERSKKKLPNELLESIRQMHSVCCGRSSEGAPKKNVFEEAIFEQTKV